MKWSPLSLLLPLLGCVLVVLKLTGSVDASWLVVLMPFWLPAAIVGSVLAAVACLILTMTMIKALLNK